MFHLTSQLRLLSLVMAKGCAIGCRGQALLLGILVGLQTLVTPLPTVAAWLPASQRDSERETPAHEESSEESAPSTFQSADSGRIRRAAAERTARLERAAGGMNQPPGVMRIFRLHRPAELAGRNGTGCPLRF